MQLCFADLEQQILNSPSRQGDGRTYQEKIVNGHYEIDRKLEMNTIIFFNVILHICGGVIPVNWISISLLVFFIFTSFFYLCWFFFLKYTLNSRPIPICLSGNTILS